MYIKILLKYLFGYLYIKIEGFFTERVFNRALEKKIFFWNIKREKSTIVYTNIGIHEFKELTKFAKESGCKIKILKRKGLPFLFNKYKKRKIFFVVILFVVISLFIMSKFIWNIQIEGLNNINREEIIQEISNSGLKIGTLKNKINSKKIINNIRLKRNDISWIGIDINGTNAIIKIVEADSKPEIINDEDFCNIIAKKDAQIIKISAQNGIPVIKEGDIVTKGEILIAGWIEGKYTGTRYVHANGEVKAKVWYSEKKKIDLNQVITEETGNTEKKYQIKFNNFTINFYKTLSNFEIYDTIDETRKIKIFSNFYLPIEVIEKTNYEKKETEVYYGNEEAEEICIQDLSKQIEETIEDKNHILQKYINSYAGEGYIEVEVIYEVLENIATKEKIVF